MLRKLSVLLSLILVVAICHGQLKNQELPLTEQRVMFIQAEEALKADDWATFHRLGNHIKDYPLYPYLLYQQITRNFETLPQEQVDKFLNDYKGSYLAKVLRQKWLNQLAEKELWNDYLDYYTPSKDTGLQCLYLTAKQHAYNYTAIQSATRKLWLTATSQPEACDDIFEQLLAHDPERDQLVKQRFLLALESQQLSLANYLLGLLKDSDKPSAEKLVDVYRFPMKINKLNPNPDLDPEMITIGLTRQARKNPKKTEQLWLKFKDQVNFSQQQKATIMEQLVRGYKRKRIKKTPDWVDAVATEIQDEYFIAWKVQIALRQQDWLQVQYWLEKLPDEEHQSARWQYWYARSKEQLNDNDKAHEIYKNISQQRNYYGFLSAAKSQQPFPINHKPLDYTTEEKQTIENSEEIQRIKEFFAIEQNRRGRNEWWHYVKDMPAKDRYIAIKIANEHGWDDLALASTMRLDYRDDLSMRFPFRFKDIVIKQASAQQLKPSLIFGLIRQESLFRQKAISHVGARGLMQIMPYTGRRIAKQLNEKFQGNQMLFDPETNIRFGSHYLGKLLREQGHPVLAIASYNAGPHRVKRWLSYQNGTPADIWVETIPFSETREYVKHVITYAMIYDYLLGNEPSLNNFMFRVNKE